MRTIILGLTALFLMACSTIQTAQHAGPTTVFVVTARPPDAATPTSVPTITPTATPTSDLRTHDYTNCHPDLRTHDYTNSQTYISSGSRKGQGEIN